MADNGKINHEKGMFGAVARTFPFLNVECQTPGVSNKIRQNHVGGGYFVSTIADVNEETIKKHAEEQYEESKKEEKGRK